MSRATRTVPPAVVPLAGIVGFLVCVELASGVLQGFYTPIFTDIADRLSIAHGDVNWFEAAQLLVSALVVPVLSRLGDLIGHRAILLGSTVVTALASWAVAFAPSFGTFLIAWALQGFSMFSVIEKASGDWIGRLGPWAPEGWPGTEVGWGIVRSAWGKGYATEGAAATIDWAFDTMSKSII